MLWEATILALRAIRRNALRSFLTLLGIMIGVGAVIAKVTIGRGTTAKVTADLSRLGSNLLVIRTGQSRGGQAVCILGATVRQKLFPGQASGAFRADRRPASRIGLAPAKAL